MTAYYNENDPFAAAWLRALITAGLIAPGDVDERSIVDVSPDDVRGYTQAHFFAGIGGWSYALRLAGWPDDRAVWTGSCPCQPFSSAGKGAGAADSRDLWPAWFRLIAECRPDVVFGEQVASADGLGWIDRVSADMESQDYAIGALDYCAAGVGAFHIRQRLWFVADASRERCDGQRLRVQQRGPQSASIETARRGEAGELADDAISRRRTQPQWATGTHRRPPAESGRLCNAGELGDADRARLSERDAIAPEDRCSVGASARKAVERASAASFWSDAIWIPCRDGKSRPTQPAIFPVAPRLPGRVGLLRGAGNSIVPQVAQAFIEAYLAID